MKKLILFIALALFFSCTKAPEPVYPIPSEEQVAWQQMECYAFIHFGLNTFTDMEWGYGNADPALFNPDKLDCEQWARTFVAAGFKGVILTAKHHDGFCLWPSAYGDYNITLSPYKNGQGDIVGELAAACRKYGLRFGFYLSPWDRHQASYGSPAYVDYFHNQLEELLTRYGPVFEIWFDGANGGDGWYGGAKEKRTIDRRNYYDFPRAYRTINRIQSDVIIFSDGGPGCRWVGNERGFAGETNWSFLRDGVYAGYPEYQELTSGHADGTNWVAAECDVSIRPGWFFHESQNRDVKTAGTLADLYYKSVGRNATFLLNFPVNREGLISTADSLSAVQFRQIINEEMSLDLLAGIAPQVSNSRGRKYRADRLTDRDINTYWATEDGVTEATIEFELKEPATISRLLLQEYIPLGQRVEAFSVEYLDSEEKEWRKCPVEEATTTIGYKRILRLPQISAKALRITINDSRGPVCLSTISAY